jgi:hypothetical protein
LYVGHIYSIIDNPEWNDIDHDSKALCKSDLRRGLHFACPFACMLLMPHIHEDGDTIKITCPCDNEIIGVVCAKHENDGTVILTSNLGRLCYSEEVAGLRCLHPRF